jgi:hypothetical protein
MKIVYCIILFFAGIATFLNIVNAFEEKAVIISIILATFDVMIAIYTITKLI